MIKSSPERTPLTSAQLRAGRALIRWSAEDLARASSVGLTTIRRAELTDAETSMTAANDLAVRRALEAAGVEFIDENGGGPGVRLRKSGNEKPRNRSGECRVGFELRSIKRPPDRSIATTGRRKSWKRRLQFAILVL